MLNAKEAAALTQQSLSKTQAAEAEMQQQLEREAPELAALFEQQLEAEVKRAAGLQKRSCTLSYEIVRESWKKPEGDYGFRLTLPALDLILRHLRESGFRADVTGTHPDKKLVVEW